jgi:cbb3-type cytochrome oxidase subunit 1
MDFGIRLIQIAAVYMVMGLVMGLWMSIATDFILSPVHAHITLLGWVTMAITGIVYTLQRRCARNQLARLHFWGHNVGLPIMMISLSLYLRGMKEAEKAIAAGSVLVIASLVLFAVNLMRNGGPEPVAS